MCKVVREFQRDFCREMEDATFCPTERKYDNTSDTFTNILTGLGLIQMVHIKCTSARGHTQYYKSILWIQRAIRKRPENC